MEEDAVMQERETLVKQRVPQLQDLLRRRDAFLTEMFYLLERKDKFASVLTMSGHESELRQFLQGADLAKTVDLGDIAELLKRPAREPTPPLTVETAVEEKTATPSPNVPAEQPLESPMSEPPASPPLVPYSPSPSPAPSPAPVLEPEIVDLRTPEPELDIMDVDEEEPSYVPPTTTSMEPASPPSKTEPPDEDVIVIDATPEPTQEERVSHSPPLAPQAEESVTIEPEEEHLPEAGPLEADAEPPQSPARTSATRETSHVPSEVQSRSLSPQLLEAQAGVSRELEKSQETEASEELEMPTEPQAMEGIEEEPAHAMEHEGSQISLILGPPVSKQGSEDNVLALLQSSTYSELPLPIARTDSAYSPSQYHLSAPPAATLLQPTFSFDGELSTEAKPEIQQPTPTTSMIENLLPQYTLPPLSLLPAEFHRKKSSRQQRKREKEKEKGDGKSLEWAPMGINKWGAVLNANPVWKRVSRATKSLSTRDWNIAVTELKLIRTLDRVELLKEAGRWSFRQPKKQRGVGGLMKTHRDYLMDEMKWMRTDFREERRWKLALAYNLAHAVMEWHEAESLEERVRRGICVLWKRPKPEDLEGDDSAEKQEDDLMFGPRDGEDDGLEDSKENSTPADGYGSDEDSDDEQDKDQQDVIDALEPATAIQEALDDVRTGSVIDASKSQDIQPKIEDIEDLSALRKFADESAGEAMEVDSQSPMPSQAKTEPDAAPKVEDPSGDTAGLRSISSDPLLAVGAPVNIKHSVSKSSKAKANVYAPLREQIVYSDLDQLFIDPDDFDLAKSMSELSTDDSILTAPPPPADLSAIFPDLQPYGLLDVAPITGSLGSEGKRKSDRRADRDDPNKRAEDTTYTKLTPMNEFMYHKPTLLGPLQPARHFNDSHWHDLDDTAIVADLEAPSTRPVEETVHCALFDSGGSPRAGSSALPASIFRRRTPHEYLAAALESKSHSGSSKHRVLEHIWTPQDDALLKRLVEKYPNNWILIADAFNASRVTIATDKRTPSDCQERWKARLVAGGSSSVEEDIRLPPQTPTPQMTTRGTKRSISVALGLSNVGASTSASAQSTDSRKRRRHNLMADAIRKAAKKREVAQKAQSAQRKPPAVHDTHGQYAKMPRYTPAELCRMKAEKDTRDAHELMMARKRQDELNRQHMLQQQQRLQGTQAAQAPAQNGAVRPTNGIPAAQGVPQIRSQVNISQQQRISSQMALANARMSPSQAMQAQVQARALAAVQAQQQAQAQAQAQVQAQVAVSNSLAAGVAPALSSAHLSAPYAARAASSSPGLPQQSPPMASTSASPRPPSAQSHAGMVATSQTVPINTVSHSSRYYPPVQNAHSTQMSPEQTEQRLRALFLQQQVLQQQQQSAQNSNYPHS